MDEMELQFHLIHDTNDARTHEYKQKKKSSAFFFCCFLSRQVRRQKKSINPLFSYIPR